MARDAKIKIAILGDSKDGQRAMREYSQSIKEVEEAHDRLSSTLSSFGKTSTKILGAMPALGVAAGAGVAAGLMAIPVALGAVAASVLSNNEEVRQSYSDLWDEVKVITQDAVEPLADTFVDIANELSKTAKDIKPDLEAMFIAAEPGLRQLGSGVSDFVRNAMPGFRKAVESSYDPLKAMRNLLGSTGEGVNDFFTNLSTGSKSSATLITELGRIIQNILGFAGSLLAKLSNAFEGNFGQIREILASATSSLSAFADGALPVLASAATAALDVVTALLKALEPFSGVLGTVTASMLVAGVAGKGLAAAWSGLATAAAVFSTGGPLAKGLQGLASKTDDVALKGASLAESFTGSSKAGMGLVSTGTAVSGTLGSIAAALPAVALGLGGVALIAGALILENKALKDAGDELSSSLAKGGEEAKKAAEKLAQHRRELAEAKAANDAWADSADNVSDAATNQANILYEKQKVVDAEQRSWEELLASMGPVERAQAEYNKAVAESGPNSEAAMNAAAAWRIEIDKSTASQQQAADAIKTTTQRMVEQFNQQMAMLGSDLAYRDSVNATANAQKKLTDTITANGAKSEEAADATRALERAQLNQINSAAQLAAATYTGTNETERGRLAAQAATREIFNLAAANNGALSPSLLNSVRNMNAAQLAAAGVTARVNETGHAVLTMPGGKTVTLGLADYANWPLQQAINKLNSIYSKTVTVRVNNEVYTSYYGGRPVGMQFKAEGGHMKANMPTVVGEEGMEMIWPNKTGYVSTAEETADFIKMMRNAKSMAMPSVPQMSDVSMSAAGVVSNTSVGAININVSGVTDVDDFIKKVGPRLEKELVRSSNLRTGRRGIS